MGEVIPLPPSGKQRSPLPKVSLRTIGYVCVLGAMLGLLTIFWGVLSRNILVFFQPYFPYVIPGLVVLGMIGLLLLVWKLPQWQLASSRRRLDRKDYLDLENQFRATLIQTVGGIAVLVGAAISVQQILNSQKSAQDTQTIQSTQVAILEQGQITDRFTRAIDELGNAQQMVVRLGGIYALEGIAADSATYFGPVVEILTSYVRANAQWYGGDPTLTKQTCKDHDPPQPDRDIQAILTVLGRRKQPPSQPIGFFDLRNTNLRGVDLRRPGAGAYLQEAHLEGTNFEGAYLEKADLMNASLNYAYLGGAHLDDVHLEGADLRSAFLDCKTVLKGAFFSSDTRFERTDLRGVDLTPTTGLTLAQIQLACTDENTQLPANVEHVTSPSTCP